MRSIPLARTFSAAFLFGALAGTATAQDLDSEVAALLRQADSLPVNRAFELGYRTSDLGEPERPDPVRDAILRVADSLGDKGRLAAASALQALSDGAVYGKDILELLRPVSVSGDTEARAAAMALLGDERAFNRRVQPEVQEVLYSNTVDDLAPPEVRVEAATGLWGIGTNEQKAAAKETLTQFLNSTDRDLQVRGALALAEINTEPTGPGWQILREIADEPTEQGRLARMYIKREEERRQFERLLGRLVDRTGVPNKGDADEFDLLRELRMRIRAQHIRGRDLTDEELLEFAAKGMLMYLDRHSAYFTSDEFQRFFFDLNREYGGIGAFVNFDQDDVFSVVRPIYSGPAYKEGLRSGDKILAVDGWDTDGHTSDEIIARLKGKPGTQVIVRVFRPGMLEPRDVPIVREQIKVPSVNYSMIPGQIGYVELINFSSNTNDELVAALTDLQAQGARGIVLDVRNNTGGYLTAARDVVEKFVPGRKLVVYTEGRSEERRNYYTRDRAVSELPLAVLVNDLSASASEIVAGALQDHGRAVIIGKRTFGKGSVQNLIGLASQPGEQFVDENHNGIYDQGEEFDDRNENGKFDVGPHLKLTVAKYYLPSGRSIHKELDKDGKVVDPNWGVTPDSELEVIEVAPEEAWKNAAIFDLLRKGVFRQYVTEHLPENKELFLELAEKDGGDWSRYPEFDKFYEGLDTQLSRDDVRRWIRYMVRDAVADLRGKVYPGNRALGDPQEDAQLQEAVRYLLQEAGVDIRNVAEYKDVLKIDLDKKIGRKG